MLCFIYNLFFQNEIKSSSKSTIISYNENRDKKLEEIERKIADLVELNNDEMEHLTTIEKEDLKKMLLKYNQCIRLFNDYVNNSPH